MGRDQELREAARTGNITVIEKILSQRRSGGLGRGGLASFAAAGLASLRRTANPNCQDANGDTPLHHAALNGHDEAVGMLLHYEASANIVDNKGCYPLHLAAFNGHADICGTLLTHGPSKAQVNQQNNEGETALHCACQYGLTQVVNVLLEHLADPTIRNLQNESALDLAAKYGRLETVQLLLRKHPGLLENVAEDSSALHLAARHGHRHVVQVLLDAGVDINRKTDKGSALHEAAFYGKTDVVRLLLENGIDINLTDRGNNTALDLVSELKSQRALDIGRVILGFLEGKPPPKTELSTSSDLIRLSSCSTSDHSDSASLQNRLSCTPDSLSSHSARDPAGSLSSNHSGIYSLAGRYPSGTPISHGSRESVTSAGSSVFDTGQRHSGGSLPDGELDPIYDTPSRSIPLIKCNKRSSHGSDLSDSPSSSPRNSSVLAISPKPHTQVKPGETPKKPPRKKPPSAAVKMVKEEEAKLASLNNGNSSDSILTGPSSGALSKRLSLSAEDTYKEGNNPSLVRRKSSNDADLGLRQSSDRNSCDRENDNIVTNTNLMTSSTIENNNDITKMDNETFQSENLNLSADHRMSSATTTDGSSSMQSSMQLDQSMSSERFSIPEVSFTSTASSRPPSLELSSCCSQRSSREVPLSPSGYEQPPTPDHPPPSPMTAVLGIQEKINPLEKRRSRDMETITEAEYLVSEKHCCQTSHDKELPSKDSSTTSQSEEVPHSERSSLIRPARRKKETDSVINGRTQFSGLMKGSIPTGQRRIKSHLFDSVLNAGSKKKNHKSVTGLPPGFDVVMEKEGKPPDDKLSCHARDVKRLSGEVRRSLVKEARASLMREDGTASLLNDETAEWEQISAILSSCGGRMSMADFSDTDYFEKRLQQLFEQGHQPDSLIAISHHSHWLINMLNNYMIHVTFAVIGQIADIMASVGGGLDLESVLVRQWEDAFASTFGEGPDVLEEQDLLEMGVMSEDHRRVILSSSSKLTQIKTIDDCPPESVAQWLSSLRLSIYLETFLARNYNSMERVRKLWDPELSTVLDISSVGHRKRILASLGAHLDGDSSSSHGDEFQDFTKSMQSWTYSDSDGGTENYNDLNLFKDYTNIKPHPQQSADEGDDLDIRPPQVSTESPIKQWRHPPEVLIKGCCNYTAQYLGSTLVDNLQGTESTREAIQKMKKSTEAMAKVPAIVLSISYHGVKFIDAKNKSGVQHVICEHEISNIFCACQDGDDMSYFAYITRDMQADCHYCHVFSVKSTELATEVILTLGEAFEVAYQVAMREQAFLSLEQATGGADFDKSPLAPVTESSPEAETCTLQTDLAPNDDSPKRLTSTTC